MEIPWRGFLISFSFSLTNNSTANAVATQLSQTQLNLSNAIQQLSTGLRINSPSDDAAGNAISTRLQDNSEVLAQGTLNAQNAISVIQTAMGGLTQIQNILQNMVQLTTEAADSTKSTADRADIESQIYQLAAQINNIADGTRFGDQHLLDGSIQGPQPSVASALQITNNAYVGAVGNSLVNVIGVSASSLLSPNSNVSCF